MNTTKKSPLGRGLGALIDGVEKEVLDKKVEANLQIDINSIDSNPFQPRTRFDAQALEELAASITSARHCSASDRQGDRRRPLSAHRR